MKKIIVLVAIICISVNSFAQDKPKSKREERREKRKERVDALVKQEEEGVIVNKKHFVGGLKLTTDGFGFFVEKGLAQSINRSMLFQLDISERKDQKEAKQFSRNGVGPFIYGKVNYFYPVKLGVQEQFLLGNKGNKNGVSLTANIGGGISLGMLRPYLLGFDSAGIISFKGPGITPKDTSDFLDADKYSSAPRLGTGFNKIKVVPGAYLKAGLRFDYGKYNEAVSAIEVGVSAEFYSKKITQVLYQKERNFYFTAYITIIGGKRK
jgi:hypothetical protein